jgi:tripartite-type tricarboxylate transporter receptor subunit TctC
MARAETYPVRPITIIVPFPPGGSTDTVGRPLSERVDMVLGQAVIVENVAGAGGSLRVGRVARATNDGYPLSIGHIGTHVFNGATYSLQYDLLNDFEPISCSRTAGS